MWNFQAQGRNRSQRPSSPAPARDRESCIAGMLSIRGRVGENRPKSDGIVGRTRFYSTVLPSRNACNHLKINDRCHAYPSRKRRAHFHRATITVPITSTNSRLKTGWNPLTLLTLVMILVIQQTQLLDQSSGSVCGIRKPSSAL